DGQAAVGWFDFQRSEDTMELIGAADIVLSLAEIGKHIRKTPAGAAKVGPAVIIAAVTTGVDHAIEAARAAEYPTLQPSELPVVQPCYGVGLEAPMIGRIVADEKSQTGDAKERTFVGGTGLQQQDMRVGVFRKAAGHDGTRSARADDDI